VDKKYNRRKIIYFIHIIYDSFYLKRYNAPDHPENACRFAAIKGALNNWKFWVLLEKSLKFNKSQFKDRVQKQ